MNALIERAENHYDEFFGSEEHIGNIPKSKDEFISKTMTRM